MPVLFVRQVLSNDLMLTMCKHVSFLLLDGHTLKHLVHSRRHLIFWHISIVSHMPSSPQTRYPSEQHRVVTLSLLSTDTKLSRHRHDDHQNTYTSSSSNVSENDNGNGGDKGLCIDVWSRLDLNLADGENAAAIDDAN
jgi:hypothetical protein